MIAALVLTGLAAPAAWSADADVWRHKVHPFVVEEGLAKDEVEFLIVLDEQADLSGAAILRTKEDRGRLVHELLVEVAARTQAGLIAWLAEREIAHRRYWIANMIWARAGLDVVAEVASRSDVRRIDANPRVRLRRPEAAEPPDTRQPTGSIEWGIVKTNADQVWAMGFDGTGIVVGSQDTGYEWEHPALINQYRGWNGSFANHDYNWHDAIHSGGGICGADAPEPCDDHEHGTHTMGTSVGDDGGTNQIGMAPGAEWMGCRNMEEGVGTPATYAECFEFLVAPTDMQGNNPDPSKAPHVINNSWGCPPSEGCSPDTLQSLVENTRAAGIVVVASAGNSGSSCSSIYEPPGIYDATLTVGSTDSSDKIANSSGRGPITVDGSNRMKPDVTAPGVGVRSSVGEDDYDVLNGTSMAAPHVTGLIALLLDARPDLIGQVEVVEEIVRLSAVPRTSSQDCGGFPGSEIPNPVYGHGRVDALAALVDDADGDGVDNLNDCAPLDDSVWASPGPASEVHLARLGPATELSWSPPLNDPSIEVSYDVMRTPSAADFDSADCLVSGTTQTTFLDASLPSETFYYLVRTRNACGSDLGTASDGAPRTGALCPDPAPRH